MALPDGHCPARRGWFDLAAPCRLEGESFLLRLAMRLRFSLLFLVLFLAACAGSRPDGGALEVTAVPATGATEHELLVAATRERATTGSAMFSGERTGGLDFADLSISVPPNHQSGEIEWPSPLPGDPDRQFVARSLAYVDGTAAFRKSLAARVATLPKGRRSVAVIVHGYNNDFDEAVFRATQIVHDTGFDGVPVLFTWASRGSLFDYSYDRDSATIARDGLEELLRIASESGVEDLYVFAHSMGAWATMEALRQAEIAGRGSFGGKLRTVVLAAPDIDVDVFKAEMRVIGRPKYPFVLFSSSDDQALWLSGLIAGEKPRLGAYTEDTKAIADLGVIVIDISATEANDSLAHNKFAVVLPDFVNRIGERLRHGDRLASGRTDLSETARSLTGSFGSLVGNTAGAVITLPAYLLSLPARAVTH
jgi:esterase/lipase superfamily enzyme